MQHKRKITKIKGHVQSQLWKQILTGKLCFRPFWKDKISENLLIEIVIEIFKI